MRAKIIVHGAVQGVGFRPFVYRLATELHLTGWVLNSSQGVFIEVEGERVREFARRLGSEKPPLASIQSLETTFLDPVGYTSFEIRESEDAGAKTAFILPDIATCPDCLREIFDPNNRRYGYAFTNCTNCGPRFSIVESLPYDRPNTSMKKFTMCPDCEREYHDPSDRRFHAQPNACPKCGPQLSMSIREAADVVRAGGILALKGIGGFQLISCDEKKLRERKHRAEKPFAMMYPSLEGLPVSTEEARLLTSPAAPIVLLAAKNLGVMLPYSPLHHLLMHELGFPVICTSGNLSDEPICTEDPERLAGIADAFLTHDRPIVRHVDDSVVRVMAGREMVIRRARGYAPLPVHVKEELPVTLALGGQLKNAVALSVGHEVFISQHIGDLGSAYSAFQKTVQDLPQLYDVMPEMVVCDLHPDYFSSRGTGVQHHYAHVLSCMAENELDAPMLGVAWDGTGYGTDGTIWGGEFLLVNEEGFERVAHLRQFRLPGGEAAIKEPRRIAAAITGQADGVLGQMLRKGINSPVTSSAGRLFDAVASLLGIRHRVSFEGQAAMELEWAIEPTDECYPAGVDWRPMIEAMLKDDAPVGIKAGKFHNTMVETIVQVAKETGEEKVALTGGCFQNRYLTERTVRRLREEGFRPYWHQRVPPNDGGIALGQVIAAARTHLCLVGK